MAGTQLARAFNAAQENGNGRKQVWQAAPWIEEQKRRHQEYLRWVDETMGQELQAGVKALQQNAGATGGYLVPTEFVDALQEAIDARSMVARYAQRIAGTRPAVLPSLDYNADTGTVGGAVFEFVPEGSPIPQSSPAFGETRLIPRKLAALIQASNELLNDSSLAGILGRLFAQSYANRLDALLLTGSGAGQPLGVLASPATVGIARASAGAISEVDVAKMHGSLLPQSVGRVGYPGPGGWDTDAAWFLSPSAFRAVNEQEKLYMFVNSGKPVYVSEHLPQLGTPGDVVLADFRYYLLRMGELQIVRSAQGAGFAADESQLRYTVRLDGSPWMNVPVTLGDGSSVSPFVKLN